MCLKRYKSFLKQTKINVKYCENCGAYLEEGTKFCPECGQEAKIKTAASTNENKTNKKIIYILIAIIIVFILLITLSIGGVFNPPDKTVKLEKYDLCENTCYSR